MKNLVFDEKMVKGAIKFLAERKKIEIALDENDFDDIAALSELFLGTLEYCAEVLGENKSKEEEVTLSIPEYFDLTVSHREGEGGTGNWGIGAVVGSEIKKRIKDDDALEEE